MNESINIEEMLQTLEQQDRAITKLKEEVSQRTETVMDYRDQNIMLERENGNLLQQIQTLSSEKSKLKSKVQELADKVVKMNKADLILKENDRLREDNKILIKEAENAKRTSIIEKEQVQSQYRSYFDEVAQKENVVLQKEKIADEKLKNIRAYIDMESEEKAKKQKIFLEKVFKIKTFGYQIYVISALLYGLLITVFTAIKTKQIADDCVEFFSAIGKGFATGWKYLYQFATYVSAISNKVPQESMSIVLHWLIIILIIGIVFTGLTIGIVKVFISVKDYYKEWLMDKITLTVMLISFALLVFFGEELRKGIPINLILMWILAQGVYVGVRTYAKKWKMARW